MDQKPTSCGPAASTKFSVPPETGVAAAAAVVDVSGAALVAVVAGGAVVAVVAGGAVVVARSTAWARRPLKVPYP